MSLVTEFLKVIPLSRTQTGRTELIKHLLFSPMMSEHTGSRKTIMSISTCWFFTVQSAGRGRFWTRLYCLSAIEKSEVLDWAVLFGRGNWITRLSKQEYKLSDT